MKTKYIIEATGPFFDVCIEIKSEAKLKKQLKHLKDIHQNEVKRIMAKHVDDMYFWRKRKKPISINHIIPDFKKLKIQITQCY